jgi:hypothetical protein
MDSPCQQGNKAELQAPVPSSAWLENPASQQKKAFRRLGGRTRIIVLDNLKDGVFGRHLLVPQRDHGINTGGPPRRYETRSSCDEG